LCSWPCPHCSTIVFLLLGQIILWRSPGGDRTQLQEHRRRLTSLEFDIYDTFSTLCNLQTHPQSAVCFFVSNSQIQIVRFPFVWRFFTWHGYVQDEIVVRYKRRDDRDQKTELDEAYVVDLVLRIRMVRCTVVLACSIGTTTPSVAKSFGIATSEWIASACPSISSAKLSGCTCRWNTKRCYRTCFCSRDY